VHGDANGYGYVHGDGIAHSRVFESGLHETALRRMGRARPVRYFSTVRIALLFLTLAACVPDGPGQSGDLDAAIDAGEVADVPIAKDAASDDAEVFDDAATDAGEPDAMTPLVPVAHAREFRAVWVATVSNINFPSSQNLTAAQQQAELRAMVEACDAVNLNAIVFQARPESDALYASTLEPWSRFLTGTQGEDPGYDPLQYLIEQAHARAIEVHAWLNPYRAKVNRNSTAVAPHISLAEPDHAHVYGNFLWMDPGAAAVQQRMVDVTLDLVARYELDGIHFDDYFYPYPDGTDFPDDLTWNDYVSGGGNLARDDWRRENVHTLVSSVSAAIISEKPNVRFGIAPFGIYRPGMPPGISGLDQYDAIYSDPLRWIAEGWIEYLAPQLYWPTTQTAQAYEPLLEWWVDEAGTGTYLFSGNFLSQLGSSATWDVDEFRAQLDLNRALQPPDRVGEIFFQIDPILENRAGINDALVADYYPKRALTPKVLTAPSHTVDPPLVEVDGTTVRLTHATPAALRAWVLYREVGADHQLEQIYPADTAELSLSPGNWAISAADISGYESMGVVVSIR
jgi:uncharacterized lipoprotein YddW (UPF0748 family)